MTVLGIFQMIKSGLWGGRQDSKSRAKSRLHFVLVQDRTGLSSDDMASFKRELTRVIERYFVIDKQAFDVSYRRDRGSTTLLINSPVVVRRQEAPDQNVGARRERVRKNRRRVRARNGAAKPPVESGSGPGPTPEPGMAV